MFNMVFVSLISFQGGITIMKIYIQSTKDYMPHNYNFFSAYQGFKEMGFEMIMFHKFEELKTSRIEDIVVGYVDTVRQRLFEFDIITPEIDYPNELKKFLGRSIWNAKMSQVANNPEMWPVFIKPVEDKKFTGVVVRSSKDLMGCGTYGEDPDIICSEIVKFKAEWRCFVRYNRILDVRPYKGDWRVHYNPQIIEDAVKSFSNAPNGYAMDFGVTDKGDTILIEVNDGYALGSYGLFYLDYAKLLSARWAELTQTADEYAFYLKK